MGKVTIAGARVSRGMTQQQLADVLGISKNMLNQMENGKKKIRPAYIIAIGAVTGFDKEDFILPGEST